MTGFVGSKKAIYRFSNESGLLAEKKGGSCRSLTNVIAGQFIHGRSALIMDRSGNPKAGIDAQEQAECDPRTAGLTSINRRDWLKLTAGGGRKELRHYFSDLGGGLGRTKGFFSPRGERPNEFGWTFTRAVKSSNGHASFRIADFKPIDDTPAFAGMTHDDARWMARLIGQLTEEQIVQALVASGFDSAQVKVYAEKLVSRRDQMIRDLELADEIPLLRPNGVDKAFSYDPASNGPARIRIWDGEEVIAESGSSAVETGRVVARAGPRRPGHWPDGTVQNVNREGGIGVDSRRN